MSARRVLIALGVALALADASVVTLALPPILTDLNTTVEGVAAVIGVYTLVLTIALPVAAWLRRRVSDPTLGAAGFGVFALAGALAGTPDALAPMLAFRGLQALGAAAALVGGFRLLRGGRLWAAAIFGTAHRSGATGGAGRGLGLALPPSGQARQRRCPRRSGPGRGRSRASRRPA